MARSAFSFKRLTNNATLLTTARRGSTGTLHGAAATARHERLFRHASTDESCCTIISLCQKNLHSTTVCSTATRKRRRIASTAACGHSCSPETAWTAVAHPQKLSSSFTTTISGRKTCDWLICSSAYERFSVDPKPPFNTAATATSGRQNTSVSSKRRALWPPAATHPAKVGNDPC